MPSFMKCVAVPRPMSRRNELIGYRAYGIAKLSAKDRANLQSNSEYFAKSSSRTLLINGQSLVHSKEDVSLDP